MTLLEILVNELESWPEGKEYAYQSSTSRMAFFASSPMDDDIKSVILSHDISNRAPYHKVTREQWQTAKIKSAPYFKDVAAVLGEEKAIKELQAVGEIDYTVKELEEAFVFGNTPQGYEFWDSVRRPNRDTKLKLALNTITAAMKEVDPNQFIRLHPDGSGTVRGTDNEETISFDNTDELVEKYLACKPKFDHWHLLTERFKWIAKDSDGDWWAYTDKPTMSRYQWSSTGKCRSLDILKVDIPCHWSRSLIERPTSQGEIE